MNIQRALRRLEAELKIIEDQPHKMCHQIDARTYLNVLSATLVDGTSGSKTIWYDEVSGHSFGVVAFRLPGRPMMTLGANEVTAKRCALMALYAMRGLFPAARVPVKIGLIGYGKINRAVEEMLLEHFDMASIHYIIGRKNAGDYGHLRDCDVVITATTADRNAVRLTTRDYDGPVISFDGGLILDGSFRHRPLLADHPSQLEAHWNTEFPGEVLPETIAPLWTIGALRNVAVHLYGIGAADLIVAKELVDARHGVSGERQDVPPNDAGPSDQHYGWQTI